MPVIVFVLLLAGCFTGTLPSPPPKLLLQWTPPAAGAPARRVAVAIVGTAFDRHNLGSYGDAPYLTAFAQSLDADIQRALLAKGLKLTGPFDAFDSMTFPEKKACDLALVPQIQLEISESYSVNRDEPTALGGRSIRRQGQLSARGFVNLTLIEPLSQQKMWVKEDRARRCVGCDLGRSSDG